MATQRKEMTVSTGSGKGATSVKVTLPIPQTDADWRKHFNLTPAERDAKAMRQVAVDVANGGGRDSLREGVKMGLKGKELQKHVQAFYNDWRAGTRTTKVPVQDLRELPDIFGAEQLQVMVESAEEQGFHVLLNEKQQEALEALKA